ASAERLAAEGAAVLVAALDEAAGGEAAAAICARSGRAEFVRTDVTDESQVRAMVEAAVERLGGLDLLVNNAGGGGFLPFERLEPAAWGRIVGGNLPALLPCCPPAPPPPLPSTSGARGRGRISGGAGAASS